MHTGNAIFQVALNVYIVLQPVLQRKYSFADPALLLKPQVDPENISCAALAKPVALTLPSYILEGCNHTVLP